MIPPVDKSFEFLLLSREWRDNRVMVYLPTGDSYYLKVDELRLFLRLSEYEDFDSLVDYVWNFYSVFVDFQNRRYFWIGKDDLKKKVEETRKFQLEVGA